MWWYLGRNSFPNVFNVQVSFHMNWTCWVHIKQKVNETAAGVLQAEAFILVHLLRTRYLFASRCYKSSLISVFISCVTLSQSVLPSGLFCLKEKEKTRRCSNSSIFSNISVDILYEWPILVEFTPYLSSIKTKLTAKFQVLAISCSVLFT